MLAITDHNDVSDVPLFRSFAAGHDIHVRAGYRASRNELVKEVLRDYRYIEATGDEMAFEADAKPWPAYFGMQAFCVHRDGQLPEITVQ